MLLTSGLALAIAGVAFVIHDMQSYRRFTTENLYTLARLISENSTAALSFVDAQAARETLDGLRAEPQIVYAAIFRRDGRLFAEYRSSAAPAELPASSQLNASPWSTFVIAGGNEGDRGVDNAIEVYKKIRLLGDDLGVVIVRANLTELDARWRWELAILLSVLLAAGSAANFLAARFQRKISEPILALEDAMRDFSENHNYNAFVEKNGDDEIGRLITGFNKMLDQILVRDKRLAGVITELNVAKESAELANNTKSRFIATLSHEIRNPMTGVLGMAELLVREQPDGRSQNYARSIHRATENLLHFVNDILDYSKIESGRMTLESIEFSLLDAIEAVIDVFASQACAKGIDLIYVLPPQVPRRVCGDPVRLRQVLANLIGNGIKFTESGCVAVFVSCADPGEHVEATNVAHINIEFAVTDTGIGIPESAQSELFEAFSQADMSTTRRYGGSGLGLAITKELVDLMGGRLSVVSQVGHGSTFNFNVCFGSVLSVDEELPLAPTFAGIVVATRSDALWESLRLAVQADGTTVTRWQLGQLRAIANGAYEAELLSTNQALIIDWDSYVDHNDLDGEALAGQLVRLRAVSLWLVNSALRSTSLPQLTRAQVFEKPVRYRELRRRMAMLAHTDTIIDAPDSPLLASDAWRSARILLVEDNVINQEVAVNMLQHFGCAVDVVADGRRAVEMACGQHYDLVLMDWQMPEMDGLTAAQRIRQRELAGAVMPVPIVLVTATALSDELLRQWVGTINGYVAKPYSIAQLSQVLKRWLPVSQSPVVGELQSVVPIYSVAAAVESGAVSTTSSVDNAILDESAFDNVRVIQRVGRPDLVARLIELFLAHSKDLLRAIEVARQQRDSETLFREAHSLKNLSLNVGARDLARLSEAMERASVANDWNIVATIDEEIAEKYAETCQALLARIGVKGYDTRSVGRG